LIKEFGIEIPKWISIMFLLITVGESLVIIPKYAFIDDVTFTMLHNLVFYGGGLQTQPVCPWQPI
jgi:hypothetical protein